MRKLLAASAIVLALTGVAGAAPVENGGGARQAQAHQNLSKLPPAKAEAVKKIMAAKRNEQEKNREELKGLYAAMKAQLNSPKFEKDAYLALARRAAALQQTMSVTRAESIAEAASQLTHEERKILAAGWDERRHGFGGGKRGLKD